MSVAGYIGKNIRAPRIPRADDKNDLDEELKKLELERETEAYKSVEDYDPVLRSHCRL